LGSAVAAVVGAVIADVWFGEHPTHSAVLGAVAVVVAMLSRQLTTGVLAALPAVAGAGAVQPVLHLGSKTVRPDVVLHGHSNHLGHVLVDEAVTAFVQIAVPVLVIFAVAIGARLVRLVVDTVRRPLAPVPAPSSLAILPVLLRVRPVLLGSMLRWCGWAILAARRGPPPAPAHAGY
jgi:hypothetical protein